jgi:homopolymeric O-antigen transport system permease protein
VESRALRQSAPYVADDASLTIIQPSRGWVALNLREVWQYRQLLYFLVWRDVKVRYKQTLLGAAWVILQPVLTMLMFSLFFGRLASVPSDGIPYPLFVYTALLPWQLFAYAVTESGNSLVGNRYLITKVYFPRLIIPLAAVLAGLVDFAIASLVLAGMLVYYHTPMTPAILTLPVFLVLALATALAVGLWLSALNVQYRDVRYTIPFLTQFWLIATPIAYSASLIPDNWRVLYELNPMAGVVEGFRWALLGKPIEPMLLLISAGAVLGLLALGIIYFRRMERGFADVV